MTTCTSQFTCIILQQCCHQFPYIVIDCVFVSTSVYVNNIHTMHISNPNTRRDTVCIMHCKRIPLRDHNCTFVQASLFTYQLYRVKFVLPPLFQLSPCVQTPQRGTCAIRFTVGRIQLPLHRYIEHLPVGRSSSCIPALRLFPSKSHSHLCLYVQYSQYVIIHELDTPACPTRIASIISGYGCGLRYGVNNFFSCTSCSVVFQLHFSVSIKSLMFLQQLFMHSMIRNLLHTKA